MRGVTVLSAAGVARRLGGVDDRLYFRRLLSGVDFGLGDELAQQMRNFVYLLGDRQTGEAVAVDPAYDPAGIVRLCEADDMRLTGVLATHYHADHVGGAMMGFTIPGIAELLEIVDVPVHVQADEAAYVTATTGIGPPEMVTHADGEVLTVGALEIELIHTPGHTPGSQCFLVGGRLLSGDTLFLEGCGRTDLPGGDATALYDSLTRRLARVPDDTVLFPGHFYAAAPSAPLGQTRRSNFVFTPRTPAEWLRMFGN